MDVSVRCLVKKECQTLVRGLPFTKIKNTILGKRYALSIALIGDKRARSLNKKYRRGRTPANVLSFPFSETEGEIVINPRQAKRDARRFGMTHTSFLTYLLIHGMLHLKGFRHGSKMEEVENKFKKRFNLN